MDKSNKYCEYFDVDETYFPCIDESAINAGVKWESTYPHETFIEMLEDVEKMLSGTTKRSLWIHGAYGTGKSQCAYALKKILEVPEEEVRAYWNRYSSLRKNTGLLEKIIGHKEQGVVTAYRYASGSITSPQQLFLAIQESIKESLDKIPDSYKGEETLKEAVIAWLEDPINNDIVNRLLQLPKWMSLFSQSSADEIINTLKKSTETFDLMENIFTMARERGFTALTLTADSLCNWITDVITKNRTKIVFIWDEFSGFFRQNRNSLDEFQKIVSLCEEVHFYFVIVTHPISSIAGASVSKDDPMSVVQQRFNKVEISLPSNIAFELIGHAFPPIPAAKKQWEIITEDLSARVASSCRAVMMESDVTSSSIMQDMLPIHPMAALVLKNIASSFQSNQRSMFDFIKTPEDLDTQAFQWFIKNNGPTSDRPFLTIDMLWDFFYEKGKDYLSPDIRMILDTFPQQKSLMEKEKNVLKTILIMQAVDLRLGGIIPLLKPTDQNLSYAFEGDSPEYETGCKGIAKSLVSKGILIYTQVGDGKKAYMVAVYAGDSAKIDVYRKEIRENSTISKLIDEGDQLPTALSLTPPLKLRYEINTNTGNLPIVSVSDFTKNMDILKSKDVNWHFYAVLALAKDETEAQKFRIMIKQAVAREEYKNIAIIDALSTPLGIEEFENYVEHSAMSMYYKNQVNNIQQSNDSARKAKEVLNRSWRDRIHEGPFIVWTYDNQAGEKANGAAAVHTILQTIVLSRFKYTFDFTKGMTESQLKLTHAKQVSRYGMGGKEIKGLIAGCEKSVLGKVWNLPSYWEKPDLKKEPISIIKVSLNNMIENAFASYGRISIDEIYDYLVTNYGFSPCNLSAFIIGFLLKEYSSDPYRFEDSEGHRELMTPDKLSEMIGNTMNNKSKTTYIVSMTEDEKAFYELTEIAWGITPNSFSSPAQASSLIQNKMRNFAFPVWCLSEVDTLGVYDVVKKYAALVQSNGQDAHDIINEIGQIARQRPSCAQGLKNLLTPDNFRKGMMAFLTHFEDGKLIDLAEKIGATDYLLSDIKKLFSVKYSSQWIKETGEDEIRKLMVDYEVVYASNILLNVTDHTKEGTFKSWRSLLRFIGFTCESVRGKFPNLDKLFSLLLKIANREDMLSENMSDLLAELTEHNCEINDLLSDTLGIFMEIYAPYLEGFSREECEEIKGSIKVDMFPLSATKGNAEVKRAAEDYRKKQIRVQLYKFWRDKTSDTKNPRDWSEKYKTPILCCIDPEIYGEAKKAFSVLNSSTQTEAEIRSTLDFLEKATFFDKIESQEYRDNCFRERILGYYEALLPNLSAVRSALDKLSVDPYDWDNDPTVKDKIISLANAEYNAGISDEAMKVIDGMNDIDQLKVWLKDLVGSDMELGIKIIKNGGR